MKTEWAQDREQVESQGKGKRPRGQDNGAETGRKADRLQGELAGRENTMQTPRW